MEKIIVLDDTDINNINYFDCTSKTVCGKERIHPYNDFAASNYLRSLNWQGYDYEKEICIPKEKLQLLRLSISAYNFAKSFEKTPFKSDCWIVFNIYKDNEFIAFNPFQDIQPHKIQKKDLNLLTNREEIKIDARLLFGLLVNIYIWDNAYIGSLYEVKRIPDIYRPDLIKWLNWFHV